MAARRAAARRVAARRMAVRRVAARRVAARRMAAAAGVRRLRVLAETVRWSRPRRPVRRTPIAKLCQPPVVAVRARSSGLRSALAPMKRVTRTPRGVRRASVAQAFRRLKTVCSPGMHRIHSSSAVRQSTAGPRAVAPCRKIRARGRFGHVSATPEPPAVSPRAHPERYLQPQQQVNELSRQMPVPLALAVSRSQLGCAGSLQSASEWHEVVHRQCCVGPPPGQH